MLSVLGGGLLALRYRGHLHRFLGFTAGILIGVVAFGLLPEIFELLEHTGMEPTVPMTALVLGFLAFHILEKSILIHHNHESEYPVHSHPHVGIASALAIIGHSFIDGMAIALGFQAGAEIGLAIAVAVIAHGFSDGLNTVNLMLLNKNRSRRTLAFLGLNALAPLLGALSTALFQVSDSFLVIYLGFFAGFLLYIGASEILPQAHSKRSSYQTILLTIAGAAFIFVITQLIGASH